VIEPFLKWAGGKRWLVKNYRHLFPLRYKAYFEPFLGSGAVYFYLSPKRALLSDSNKELINAYQQLQSAPRAITQHLHRYQILHNDKFYYKCRDSLPDNPIERAVRFIYLNRTCWNGLYRENRNGKFNVPLGSKTLVEFPENYLEKVSEHLTNAKILDSDFEDIIDIASADDLVYLDPPYTVTHNNNNFIKYNSRLFSWDDQIRLCEAVKRAASRGAWVVVSNANHECVRSLYKDFGIHHLLERVSLLSADAERRVRTTELCITNFGRNSEDGLHNLG